MFAGVAAPPQWRYVIILIITLLFERLSYGSQDWMLSEWTSAINVHARITLAPSLRPRVQALLNDCSVWFDRAVRPVI